MGASSSTAAGINGKERRKSTEESGAALLEADKRARRLLLQNGLLRRKSKAGNNTKAEDEAGGNSWQTKAHSMYDLQQMRGKSVEAEEQQKKGDDAARHEATELQNGAGSANGKKHRLNKITTSLSKSLAEPASPSKSVSIDLPSPSPSPGSGTSPQQENAASSAALHSQKSASQRRRPLTWAWIRGHDVNLPAQPPPPQPAPVVERRPASRRRSLRSGIESRLSAEGHGGCQRQNSANAANSAECSTANGGPPLGRRCSHQANATTAAGQLSNGGRQKASANRRSDAGFGANANLNPINANGREIIQFCFDNPHNEIGSRICSRLLEKRTDFRQFAFSMGKERWQQMTGRLKEFLESVVRKVDNIEMVERLSRKYGEEHVQLKCFGFKPDFWVSLADAMTVECVILDQATHQPSDTITAWSLLVSVMFSSVRDGYYQALRAARISQRHRNVQQRENTHNLGTNQTPNSPSGVEKSASANELQSPERKTSGNNKQNTLRQQMEEQRQKSASPNGASGVIVEEKSIPVQFF
ncbi:hypothetical protein niasHT_030198 [Heterodera trifolii]|uniref:Uncharacterized protein n=1 Tax=Heterodera trifolii TaxID=157864 RepID=A0ABD2K2V9_9BILA